MTTVAEALREATRRLESVSDTARLDAELLMAEALGVSRSELLLHHTGAAKPTAFDSLVERRSMHEPVAYIVGHQEFYGLDLAVTPAVLIPRADSETLIEAAIGTFSEGEPPKRICDLGTGSGALLLAAMSVWPDADGLGLDRSLEALLVAIRNAQRHANTPIGLVGPGPHDIPQRRDDRGTARFIQRDWTKAGWRDGLGTFDLVLCNPPYVEDDAALDRSVRDFEPAGALFAGTDGLADYEALIPQIPVLLAPGGAAVLEIGASQAEAVAEIAENNGFSSELHRDLANRPRALVLRLRTWQSQSE